MALVSSPVPARRLMAAIGLIGGTAALISSKLLFTDPGDENTPDAMIVAIRAHSDAHLVSTLLFLMSGVLFVLASVAVARSVTRGQGATVTYVGACVLALGGMGHAMQSVLMLTTRALAASKLEQSQLAAAMENFGPYFAVLTPFLFATVIGIPILVAGLWRAAIVPVWPFAVAVVAAAGFFLPVTDLVPTALISLALLWAGIGVVRSTPEAVVGPSAAPRFLPATQG